MFKIAILASGSGTNAQAIIEYFRANSEVEVALILSNKFGAGVHKRAAKLGVPSLTFSKEQMEDGRLLMLLEEHKIDMVILAGFLLKVPSEIVSAYKDRIVNIHPALLPKYGGKGMYGAHVHEAVIQNGEEKSGITIHIVDEVYDHGRHLFQAEVAIDKNDTPESLAQKIHTLEHEHFPKVIGNYIQELI